jgi:hypothetical protein
LKLVQPLLNADETFHGLGSSPCGKTGLQNEFDLHTKSAVYSIAPYMVQLGNLSLRLHVGLSSSDSLPNPQVLFTPGVPNLLDACSVVQFHHLL